MLARYGGECCVSGYRVDTLHEAAHIIPYRGNQSDDATNGLLLDVCKYTTPTGRCQFISRIEQVHLEFFA